MKKLVLILILAAISGGRYAFADEGMWMINAIDKALEKNMKKRGLKLSARQIYNADAPGATISDAVVSLEFGCTGSIISDNGLMITNHHCAYGDVHSLSTPEHNYLEEGFWAMKSDEEVNIKGKSVYFLKQVVDVTEEVEALKAEQIRLGKPTAMRRLSFLLEKKYKETTDLDVMLSSMWDGSKYYLAYYKVYKDVRLVAAPPVSAAAFGGDEDNWEWPQHKCDFAMYRIYTAPDGSPAEYSPENIPLKPDAILKVSLDGYKAGDFTMVIGYPGRTNRYSTSVKTAFETDVKLPIANRMRGEQMEIIRKWMDADSQIRLKYSDFFFTLSNVQELYSGQVECVNRFDVVAKKIDVEKDLQDWIEASPERKGRWGNLLSELEEKYKAAEDAERNLAYYRETLVRGTRMSMLIYKVRNFRAEALKMNGITPKKPIELKDGPCPVEENCCANARFRGLSLGKVCDQLLKDYEALDMRVEKDLFIFAFTQYMENVSPEIMGPYQQELLRTDSNMQVLAEQLWDSSFLTDRQSLDCFLSQEHTVNEYFADPIVRFFMDSQIMEFNKAVLAREGDVSRSELQREFTRALYQMRLERGIPQYPDANSTMRITYGTVGGLNPWDCIWCDWKTTTTGLLEKHDPSEHDFCLNDRQYHLYQSKDWGRWGCGKDGRDMYVDFLTDNDITGGNSGSPVLNARGELIGLAFDGNKESLASDVWCTDRYNKCVCVDIRFVLWTLDRYAGMSYIIDEILK